MGALKMFLCPDLEPTDCYIYIWGITYELKLKKYKTV